MRWMRRATCLKVCVYRVVSKWSFARDMASSWDRLGTREPPVRLHRDPPGGGRGWRHCAPSRISSRRADRRRRDRRRSLGHDDRSTRDVPPGWRRRCGQYEALGPDSTSRERPVGVTGSSQLRWPRSPEFSPWGPRRGGRGSRERAFRRPGGRLDHFLDPAERGWGGGMAADRRWEGCGAYRMKRTGYCWCFSSCLIFFWRVGR